MQQIVIETDYARVRTATLAAAGAIFGPLPKMTMEASHIASANITGKQVRILAGEVVVEERATIEELPDKLKVLAYGLSLTVTAGTHRLRIQGAGPVVVDGDRPRPSIGWVSSVDVRYEGPDETVGRRFADWLARTLKTMDPSSAPTPEASTPALPATKPTAARFTSTRGDELTVTLACLLGSVLLGVFGMLYTPPSFYFDSVPADAALLPWWGRAVIFAGAGLLLLVGLSLAPFTRPKPLPASARLFTILEAPPLISVPVAALLMGMGALLVLNQSVRLPGYGFDTSSFVGEAALGSMLLLSGFLLAAARRQTIIDRSANTIATTFGKPIALYRRSFALSTARGVWLQQTSGARHRLAFRLILELEGGRSIPLELFFERATAERWMGEFSKWSGIPPLPPT